MNGRLIVLLDMNKLLDFRAAVATPNSNGDDASRGKTDAKASAASQGSR